MAAYTDLPDGTRVFWHWPYFSECQDDSCTAYHVTKAELMAPDPEIDADRAYEAGLAAARGEL